MIINQLVLLSTAAKKAHAAGSEENDDAGKDDGQNDDHPRLKIGAAVLVQISAAYVIV
jgi:hypothetical protein